MIRVILYTFGPLHLVKSAEYLSRLVDISLIQGWIPAWWNSWLLIIGDKLLGYKLSKTIKKRNPYCLKGRNIGIGIPEFYAWIARRYLHDRFSNMKAAIMYGKLKINGVISFNIAFQCKRYQGTVGAPEIRDFRGSLTRNIEKGLFVTTGTFSSAAKDEAANIGKQQIDLIDGEDFIDMLAEYSIGLKEVKDYEIDEEYFTKI